MGLIRFYLVLLGFTGFYWQHWLVRSILTGFEWVTLGLTRLNWVLLGFTKYHGMVLSH